MKRKLMLALLCVSLNGCNNSIFDNKVRKAVRAELKDPESAMFADKLVIGKRACISVNAKNSLGGYTGFKVAHLQEIATDLWHVETMDGELCYDAILEKKLKIDTAIHDTEQTVLRKLVEKKFIPGPVRSVFAIENKKCQEFASDAMTAVRLAHQTSDTLRRKSYELDAAGKLAAIDSGFCGGRIDESGKFIEAALLGFVR